MFEKFEYEEEQEEHLEKVAEVTNKFVNTVDLSTYFMLIPNSIYINKEKLPNNVIVYDQKEIINNFYNNLDKKIKTINVTDILLENKEKNIYFKTDHHMTSLGAYLAYTKLCVEANLDVEPLKNFDRKIVSKSFLRNI